MKLTCSFCQGSQHVPMGRREYIARFGMEHVMLHMGQRAPDQYSVLITCACGAELKQGPHEGITPEESRAQIEQFFREHTLHEGD